MECKNCGHNLTNESKGIALCHEMGICTWAKLENILGTKGTPFSFFNKVKECQTKEEIKALILRTKVER